MSGATVADFDREIERLQSEKHRVRKLLMDPDQRAAREQKRALVVGKCIMRLIREGAANASAASTWLPLVVDSAGEDAWLFDPDVLQADGYVQSPSERSEPQRRTAGGKR